MPAEWRDFFALTKPRVMTLVIFTGLCGLLAAPGPIHPVIGFVTILCIAVGAGARPRSTSGGRPTLMRA
jgi:protoheme IX farnesyltransferase